MWTPLASLAAGMVLLATVGASGGALFEDVHVVKLPKKARGYRGIPGDIIELKDNSLLMAYDHGGIKAFKSTDKGKTWGKPFQLIPNPKPPAKGGYGSPSFLRLKNGNIMISYIYRGIPRKDDKQPYYANNYYRMSADDAKTWTEHFLLSPQPGYVLVHNDRLRMLSTGRIVATAEYKAHWPSTRDHAGYVGMTFFSDDGGYSWQRSKNTVDMVKQGVEVQEADIVELKDGRVLMFARSYSGHPVFAYSEDKCASWGKGTMRKDIPMPYAGLPTVKRIPSTGDLLFIWIGKKSVRDEGGKKLWRRCGLTAAISADEGKTLIHQRDIAHDPTNDYGYQCVRFLGKDLALVAYHTNDGLHLARIGIDWFYGK